MVSAVSSFRLRNNLIGFVTPTGPRREVKRSLSREDLKLLVLGFWQYKTSVTPYMMCVCGYVM